MSDPVEILNKRFGEVFLSKSKNLNIVSEESDNGQAKQFTVYTSLLDTGAANPVVLAVLVEGGGTSQTARIGELNWNSVHVRSYNSFEEVARAGINIVNNNPQKPTSGALHEFKDPQMRAATQSENSKTYYFDQPSSGRVTLFTAKPSITTGGNQLPRKTGFLPWIAESNFVYEK